MNETADIISPARLKRDERARQYGSYENYQNKAALLAQYATQEEAFNTKVERNPKIDREELAEQLEHRLPYWMDMFMLRTLDLALIGSPECSEEWKRDSVHTSARFKKVAGVTYQDYSDFGWPRSAGVPVRKVSPEEHREVMSRLEGSGLTKPGTEVATVGKTLAQMIEEDRPQPGWIIKDVLRWGGAAMVWGASGIGKTWLTHTLMLLAAAGRETGVRNEMTGRWTLQAGDHKGAKACLLDGEMIGPDISARAKVLCGALGLRMVGGIQGAEPMDFAQLRLSMLANGDDPEEVEDTIRCLEHVDSERRERLPQADAEGGPFVDLSRIVVYPKAEQDHRVEFVDLADKEWKGRIVEFCKIQGVDVLILDNLATLSETLEEENSAANWIPLNSLIVALKKEGVATILVHHTNKTGQNYRGSTSIETTLETIIGLEKVEGKEAADGAAFKVTFKKNRAHGQPEADGNILRLKGGQWVTEVDPHEMAGVVVEMAKSLKYKSQEEIGVRLKVDQATVSRAIKTAVAKKLVVEGEVRKWLKEARDLDKQLKEPVEPEVIDDDDGPDYDL